MQNQSQRCVQLFFVILVSFSLLVSGAEKVTTVVGNTRNVQYDSRILEKQQKKEKEWKEKCQQKDTRHSSSDDHGLYSSKRRVPNSSDPLHNRRWLQERWCMIGLYRTNGLRSSNQHAGLSSTTLLLMDMMTMMMADIFLIDFCMLMIQQCNCYFQICNYILYILHMY